MAFVILNWNQFDITKKAIESVLEFECVKHRDYGIIVVDNGSQDLDREQLIEFFEKNEWIVINEDEVAVTEISVGHHVLILNKSNYGYAKGNNIGLKFARKTGYQFAVIMNNDVILKEPVVDELLLVMGKNEKIAVVGPKVMGPDGKLQGPFRRPGIYEEFFYQVFYPFLYGLEKYKRRRERQIMEAAISKNGYAIVYRLMGCFMLVRLDIIEKVNWFDENTFLYAEELILAEKLLTLGYNTAYTSRVYVFHMHEISANRLGRNRKLIRLSSDLYYYRKYRNFSSIKLFAVYIGRLYGIYILEPAISFLKKLSTIMRKKEEKSTCAKGSS